MFGRKKPKPIYISQHPFVRGYQDCMRMTCVELLGRYYRNWPQLSIEEQAYHIIDKYGSKDVYLKVHFEDWVDPAYMNGVFEYTEFLAEAVKNERARRRAHRQTVKVSM